MTHFRRRTSSSSRTLSEKNVKFFPKSARAKARGEVLAHIIVGQRQSCPRLVLAHRRLQKARSAGYQLRFAKSGLLLQDEDAPIRENELKKKLKWVTHEKLKGHEIDDLIFAWKCAKVVKSNAIVLTKGKKTVGIGGGQMSRVDSVKIACAKAQDKTHGAFLASDGFFPMPDNIEVAHAHGIRAIIQPGGSIKDQEVIDAANRAKIAMAFTGERHFKH